MIEFDVETTGLQPYSGRNEAFLWIFYDGETAEAIPFTPSGAGIPGYEGHSELGLEWEHRRQRIQSWFDRAKTEGIRAWNAKFDRGFADMAGCFDVPGDGCWHDGMVVAHAIKEDRSVALKNVAKTLFGEDAADPQTALKDWLNAENRRRAKALTDADKARAGKLKVDEDYAVCHDCNQEWTCADGINFGECPTCNELTNYDFKHRKRAATPEEREAAIKLGEELLDPATGDYRRANYSHVPAEIMHPYALEDVILTKRISDVYDITLANDEAQVAALRAEGDPARSLREVVEFERESMDAIYAIEKRGLPAREEEYRKLEQECLRNIEALDERVHELVNEADPVVYAKELAGDKWGPGGHWIEVDEGHQITSYEGGVARLHDFSANSSAQVLAALKARGADMKFMSQKDGKTPADADNLRAVDDPLAVAILNFRTEAKVLSTYVRSMIGRSYVSSMNTYKEPFIAPDSRIHATYRQVGARTGRMSCADPNMQNQPRDDLRLRYNIVAEPGHVLVTCDLTNIEMVLFAAYCGEGRLLNAVQKGEDLHVLTAKMLGLRDRPRPGGGIETARQLGKTYNFSRIYGGGLRTIRRSFRCSMDEARLLKNRFDEAYPEVSTLTNRIQWRLEDDGYIQDKLVSGRRFRVPVNEAYKATNYLVQGTAASLLKYAVCQLHKDGVPMVALVHDEIVAHVPVAEAKEAAKLIEQRMVEFEGLKGVVPLRAEADIVQRWSDAKPLKQPDGTPYLFTPKWAGGERRPVPTVDQVLKAAA